MADIPSIAKRIQLEETDFRSPVSESTAQKMGGTMNFLLDHYAIPVSTIVGFGGKEDQVPIGWFPCDGRAVSRTTYANLYTAIGTLWGVGDGLTTFNVPDERGASERMVDATSLGQKGRDPDHASRTPLGTGTSEQPGSYQDDQVRSHTHGLPAQSGPSGAGNSPQWFTQSSLNYDNQSRATGGNETRGKNVYVYKIIKW